MLKCSLYNSIEISFDSLFEKVVLGSLKPFIQLDHHVEISIYLMEAITLPHSTELGGLTPS